MCKRGLGWGVDRVYLTLFVLPLSKVALNYDFLVWCVLVYCRIFISLDHRVLTVWCSGEETLYPRRDRVEGMGWVRSGWLLMYCIWSGWNGNSNMLFRFALTVVHFFSLLYTLGFRFSIFLFLFCDFIYIKAEQCVYGEGKTWLEMKLISFEQSNLFFSMYCLYFEYVFIVYCLHVMHLFVFMCMNKISAKITFCFFCWCLVVVVVVLFVSVACDCLQVLKY